MAPAGLVLSLALGALLPPAGGTPPPPPSAWCFAEEAEGACRGEPLAHGPLPAAHCCLNPAFALAPGPAGPCVPCRAAAWGAWGAWGGCSVTCGEGTARRGQRCRGRGSCGGRRGRRWELRACGGGCCPEPGGWSPWSPWSPCSVTCGPGQETRQRLCAAPAPRCGGSCPPGETSQGRACAGPPCPRPGAWGPWGPWGGCEGSCRGPAGAEPAQSRSRRCDAPEPSRRPPGAPCPGAGSQRRPCPGLPACPEDGAWGPWAPSGPCAVTCGLGAVTLRRACDAPPPRHGGRGCPGNDTRRITCGPHGPCPVAGHWAPWGEWSPCERRMLGSIACREVVGQQKRTRACVGRSPGGAPCPADPAGTIDLRACYSVRLCRLPGNWSDWSPWSLCTPPCGESPTRSRYRECQPIYPPYPRTVVPVGSVSPVNVTFWGTALPQCPPLEGQRLRLEETRPCLNVLPCPPDPDDWDPPADDIAEPPAAGD